MKAFFGSRISDHMIRTPEGYLVCRDVPIARTGIQQYAGSEFGGEEPEKVYNVKRPEEEVFNRTALVSFEGKPVVDEHPDEDISADNVLKYIKGTCRNVRRGDSPLSDCIIADLIIYDSDLIHKIEEGKRDISCGYDCLWDPEGDDGYIQREIRGNHVAVVDRGRAGHKVAIRDANTTPIRRKNMKKDSLFGRMLQAFAADADTTPEDMEKAAKLNPDCAKDDGEGNQPQPPQNTPQDGKQSDLEERLSRIEDGIAELRNARGFKRPPVEDDDDWDDEDDDGPAYAPYKPQQQKPDALDDLEQELKGKKPAPQPQPPQQEEPEDYQVEDDDENVPDDEGNVNPDYLNKINGEADDDDDVIQPNGAVAESIKKNALEIIKNIKPLLAALPQEQRTKAADSMAALLRSNLPDTQYTYLANAKRYGHKAKDSKIMDDVAYGKMIRNKFNPHYNKKH